MGLRSPADLPDDQHVGVRPVAGALEAGPAVLAAETDAGHALPVVADVAGRTPALRHLLQERSERNAGMVGDGIDDVPPGSMEGVRHVAEPPGIVHIPVVFKVVDTPVRPLLRIVPCKGIRPEIPEGIAFELAAVQFPDRIDDSFFNPPVGSLRVVAGTPDVTGIGRHPRAGIDAELEAVLMQEVTEGLHVREFAVRLDALVLPAAEALPAVVDVDIGPSIVGQALFEHRLRRAHDLFLADGIAPAVPGIPAERRGECDLVADDDAEIPLAAAMAVLRPEGNLVSPSFLGGSADNAGFLIEFQAFWKAFGREGEGAFAGRRDAVKEVRAGAGAVNRRTVNARGRRRFRRKDEPAVVRSRILGAKDGRDRQCSKGQDDK